MKVNFHDKFVQIFTKSLILSNFSDFYDLFFSKKKKYRKKKAVEISEIIRFQSWIFSISNFRKRFLLRRNAENDGKPYSPDVQQKSKIVSRLFQQYSRPKMSLQI